MSLNTAQIFIHTEDWAAVQAASLSYLKRWFDTRFRGLTRAHDREKFFLDKNRRRSLLVLPPVEGWALLMEGRSELADLGLARHLSETLDARVLWFELQGARLRWRFEEMTSGIPLERLECPEGVWSPLGSELFAMPIHPDVEVEAFEKLRHHGLPRERLFLRSEEVTVAGENGDEEALYVLMLPSGPESDPIGRFETIPFTARFPPPPPSDEVPVKEDFHGKHEDGARTVTLETRHLRGVPNSESASQLVLLEERARARLERGLIRSGVDLDQHVIDFRYRSRDHETAVLEALVREVRLSRRS